MVACRFINVEGVPEAGGIRNRFEQITLFRSHRHLVPPMAHPYRYVFKLGHNEVRNAPHLPPNLWLCLSSKK
jgi:hypothetical protein